MRTLTESIALAAHKIGAKTRGIKRAPFTKEHRRKISLARRRLYKNKQGGRTLKKTTGYYVLTRWPNTNKSEHVYLAEKHILKRKLKKNEVVHHINKIRTDNRLENLQVMTRSEHAALHAKENYTKRKKDKYGRFV
ncbi:HNH endonuclease [Candidatus Dependentiae bacterium]|nr:MAG: HNH endonuclease [Candidatus Dependentiae bacterium]